MLEQPLDFTGCSSIQFFNSFLWFCDFVTSVIDFCDFVTNRTLSHTRGHHSHLIFCDLGETYFLPNSYLGKWGISLGVTSILTVCLCLHS